MATGKPEQKKMSIRSSRDQDKKEGTITGGEEIISALNQTAYGKTLIQTLKDSGLNYTIKIKSMPGGNFGKPVPIETEGEITGYTLNFKKYKKSELWGTRFDGAGKVEYYGAIGAHDIIDTATPKGRAVNERKEAEGKDENSTFRQLEKKMYDAKEGSEKEKAKKEYFNYYISNFEKIGLDAEYEFRKELPGNTLDNKIGALPQMDREGGERLNLEGKTPKEFYEGNY